MTKTYKAVLKSSLVMLVLFAVAGSGVAQAQTCQARAIKAEMVRAEGITEMVGDIELQCRRPGDDADSFFEATIPATLDITVQLNTNITNEISNARVVALETDAPGYQDGGIMLKADQLDIMFAFDDSENDDIAAVVFGDGELSEDGDAIEWTGIPTSMTANPDDVDMDVDDLHFDTDEDGFNLVIRGIRANAAMVGAGEDIMATVMVGSTVVHSAPLKVAGVKEGLVVKVAAVEGLQCADSEGEMAVITIQEGFVDAIVSMVDDKGTEAPENVDESSNSDSLVVTFTGIPEGVMVMVPAMVVNLVMVPDTSADAAPDAMILDPAAIDLMLREGTRTDGVGDIDEDTGLGVVELNAAGTGEVIYDIASYDVVEEVNNADVVVDTPSTDDEVNKEWVNLPVTFVWETGGDMPVAMGGGEVDVSFHPVSSAGGVSFTDSKMPRFVASNDPDMVVEIDDCMTTLLFPFVTNRFGFDTGIAITNTSKGAGSCAINFSGLDPTTTSNVVSAGGQLIWSLSSGNTDENVVPAPEFQGYITATCGFEDAYGFAFITDGFGGEKTLAQGYLAVDISDD